MANFVMRVAIDSGPLENGHKVRGIGFYTKSLIEALEKVSRTVNGLKIDAFNFANNKMKVKTGFYDVIHIPYFNPYIISIPKDKPAKIVVTIHDLIPLLYPDHYAPGIRGSAVYMRHKKMVQSMVDAIITDTETSKKDIVRLLGIKERFIYPVFLAPATLSTGVVFRQIKDRKELGLVQKKYNLPNKFVLYLGDVNYNKNISTLIKACGLADIPLVIVGKQAAEIDSQKSELKGIRDIIRNLLGEPHPEARHLVELVELFRNKNIYRLGFVSDEDLVHIFNLATVYCQPSLYEGFGLGPLQAMACGTAVINAKTQALVEVAGDAAVYADPHSPKHMAKLIERVVADSYLRANLIRLGEKRIAEFSWRKTAEETFGVYQKVFQDERKLLRQEKNNKGIRT